MSKRSPSSTEANTPVRKARLGSARNLAWQGMDNLKVSLATKPAWKDHAMALVGGAMYVVLPTAIERIFRIDLTGWRGYITSISANLLIGGLTKSPGYMAGVLGAGTAHLIYAKIQDPVFLKVFRKYAFRFDPTNVTSVMSDGAALQTMQTRAIAGEAVHVFPPSPAVAAVSLAAAPVGAPQQVTPPPSSQQPLLPSPTPTAMADQYGVLPLPKEPAAVSTLRDYESRLDKAWSSYTGGLSDAGYTSVPF